MTAQNEVNMQGGISKLHTPYKHRKERILVQIK